jgi:hypothetical protein
MTVATLLTKAEVREYQGVHMYVLNESDLKGREKRSELLLTFTVGGRGGKNVAIPNTWIPIDLTSFGVTVEDIKNNESFIHFLNRRMLGVISQDVAEEILETADAQDEYDRIYDIKRGKKEDDDSDDDDDNNYASKYSDEIDFSTRAESNDRNKKLLGGNPKKAACSTQVMTIMNKQNMSDSNRLSALKNIKSSLTKTDLKYIINNAKNVEQEKIKQFAAHQLQDLKARI